MVSFSNDRELEGQLAFVGERGRANDVGFRILHEVDNAGPVVLFAETIHVTNVDQVHLLAMLLVVAEVVDLLEGAVVVREGDHGRRVDLCQQLVLEKIVVLLQGFPAVVSLQNATESSCVS